MPEQPYDQRGGQSPEVGKGVSLQETVRANEQIYSMLIDAVTHKVLESQEERKARSRARVIGSLSIGTVVFLAIASFLANELLLLRAREAVDRAIQDNVERATFLSEVAALNFRALSLDQRDGFSENEAVELIDT